jgi:hypothetical protein
VANMSSGHGVKRKLALSGQSEQGGTGTGMMIQGANPETFKMVEDLRSQSIRASQDKTRMASLLSGVVHDALDSLSNDADGMQVRLHLLILDSRFAWSCDSVHPPASLFPLSSFSSLLVTSILLLHPSSSSSSSS